MFKLKQLIKKYNYEIIAMSKFHHTLLIRGWCTKLLGQKVKIKNITCRVSDHKGLVWTEEPGPGLDKNAAPFLLQILLAENKFPDDLTIDFEFDDGDTSTVTLAYIEEKIDGYIAAKSKVSDMFWNMVQKSSVKNILDIGGRARSKIDRSKEFKDKNVTVLDILAQENVDIVCDAHIMSTKLEPESFDAIYCISVFEHLVMPWKVALEMNKVMKTGAIGLIHSHQTIGLHDMPWDYFRFSDNAWKGIFNRHTGFEIIATELKDTQFIIPFYYKSRYVNVEKTAGFESSTVLVRKTSDTKLEWPLSAGDVTEDMYPDLPDGNII